MGATSGVCQRVLVIEDHEPSRAAMARLLKLNGREVETATSVAEAMEKVTAWQPHCVILDLWIGGERGEDVLRRIRSENLPIKVIVVTGSADHEQLKALKPLRPDSILFKPVKFAEIMEWADAAA